jgi:hypothetical protein
MPVRVIVALDPGAVKFSVTVPSGTLFSVNTPWPSVVVEMFVPAIETVTLLVASMLNAPPSSARVAVTPVPLTVPEIDGPADDDVREGPTGESDASPPPHAATATIVAARMIRFITPSPPGKLGEYWASRVPAELTRDRAAFSANTSGRSGGVDSDITEVGCKNFRSVKNG